MSKFILDYHNNNFYFILNEYTEEFEHYLSLFHYKLKFPYKDRGWKIPKSRFSEFLLWLEKYNITDYVITDSSLNIMEEMDKEYDSYKIKINRKNKIDESVLKNIELYDYQKEACNRIIKFNRFLNFLDAGLGKTISEIGIFSTLFKQGKIDAVFLIVRPILTYHWKYEILTYSNQFKEEDILLVDKNNRDKVFTEFTDKKIIIIPNNLLAKSLASYRKDYSKVKNKLSDIRWKKYVDIHKEWKKENIFLCVDEAHELSNPEANMTKALLSHSKQFEYINLMTATPAINKLEKYWTYGELLDPSLFKINYNGFKLLISEEIGSKYSIYDIAKYDDNKIKEIKNTLGIYSIQQMKKDLPEVKTTQIIKDIVLPMTKEHSNLYRTFIQEEIEKLNEEFENISAKQLLENKFPYLLQVIDNPLLLHGKLENDKINSLLEKWNINKDTKFKTLKEMLKTYVERDGEKVIIFDNHPLTLDLLFYKFQKYNSLLIHGQLKDSREERFEKQNLFNSDNDRRILLINTSIGGAGLNLNKQCRRIIYYSLPYDATLTRQSLDRTWRINSTKDSIVECLLLDHSIDLIRYNRNINRIKLNDTFLNKPLSNRELKDLLIGII